MPTLEPIKYEYKCLVCRENFKSHIPPEEAIYAWNVFHYRPRKGHVVIKCPHCYSMYYISKEMENQERFIDTFKLYRYLDKHILDKVKGYDKDLYDNMKMWFTGLKRCNKCKTLKRREYDFHYDHRTKDHLSYMCKSCANTDKNMDKINMILAEYDKVKGDNKNG